MCIFSNDVQSVEKTRIFARRARSTHQYLAYSMSYSSASDTAMILPLPVPASSRENVVRFIDLSGYEEFFSDLDSGFPPPMQPIMHLGLEDSLEVHNVGSFEASYVPGLRDFTRLDARFRLSSDVWKHLPGYSDYGFAVFKLKPGAQTVQPMALEFPTRASTELFFPTVHVHDGNVRSTAKFDHTLYCQSSAPLKEWEISWKIPGSLSPSRAELDRQTSEERLRRLLDQRGRGELGMQTFDQRLFELYDSGQISYEDALRNAGCVNELRLLIKLNSKQAKASALELTPKEYSAARSNAANYINAKEFVRIDRAQDIVHPDLHILRKKMIGTFENTDVVQHTSVSNG